MESFVDLRGGWNFKIGVEAGIEFSKMDGKTKSESRTGFYRKTQVRELNI